jgi:hypothetical protein
VAALFLIQGARTRIVGRGYKAELFTYVTNDRIRTALSKSGAMIPRRLPNLTPDQAQVRLTLLSGERGRLPFEICFGPAKAVLLIIASQASPIGSVTTFITIR